MCGVNHSRTFEATTQPCRRNKTCKNIRNKTFNIRRYSTNNVMSSFPIGLHYTYSTNK